MKGLKCRVLGRIEELEAREREREQQGLIRRLYSELKWRGVDPYMDGKE